jgi:hypothetical protein
MALKQSLEQQGLADAVQAGAMVRPAKVNGVDYVLVGSLSNLSVSKRPANAEHLWQGEVLGAAVGAEQAGAGRGDVQRGDQN